MYSSKGRCRAPRLVSNFASRNVSYTSGVKGKTIKRSQQDNRNHTEFGRK